jgi:hypothetical protein
MIAYRGFKEVLETSRDLVDLIDKYIDLKMSGKANIEDKQNMVAGFAALMIIVMTTDEEG